MATKYVAELEAGDVIKHDGQTWYVTGKPEGLEVDTTEGVITFDHEDVTVEFIDHQ